MIRTDYLDCRAELNALLLDGGSGPAKATSTQAPTPLTDADVENASRVQLCSDSVFPAALARHDDAIASFLSAVMGIVVDCVQVVPPGLSLAHPNLRPHKQSSTFNDHTLRVVVSTGGGERILVLIRATNLLVPSSNALKRFMYNGMQALTEQCGPVHSADGPTFTNMQWSRCHNVLLVRNHTRGAFDGYARNAATPWCYDVGFNVGGPSTGVWDLVTYSVFSLQERREAAATEDVALASPLSRWAHLLDRQQHWKRVAEVPHHIRSDDVFVRLLQDLSRLSGDDTFLASLVAQSASDATGEHQEHLRGEHHNRLHTTMQQESALQRREAGPPSDATAGATGPVMF